MQERSTLLIVDRNPNVREYLKRELGFEGYQILLAENYSEVFQLLNDNKKFNLVLIDPDLPDAEENRLFHMLQTMRPRTPIVIHTLIVDYLNHCGLLIEAEFIEKDGNSIERLKKVIKRQLFLTGNGKRSTPSLSKTSYEWDG